jgi:hypothetical protein
MGISSELTDILRKFKTLNLKWMLLGSQWGQGVCAWKDLKGGMLWVCISNADYDDCFSDYAMPPGFVRIEIRMYSGKIADFPETSLVSNIPRPFIISQGNQWTGIFSEKFCKDTSEYIQLIEYRDRTDIWQKIIEKIRREKGKADSTKKRMRDAFSKL